MATIPSTLTATTTTDVSGSPLARLAGPLALAAGAVFTITQLVTLATLDRSDLLASVADPIYLVNGVALFVAFCLLLIALVATYGLQAHKAGTLGVIGISAAIVGTFALGANAGWFEVFATPWIADVAPQALAKGASGSLVIGGLSSYVLFAIGWALFGIASLRARVFPSAISLAIVVGGLVGFMAASPPFGVPLGLAMAWLGVWMLRTKPVASEISVPATI